MSFEKKKKRSRSEERRPLPIRPPASSISIRTELLFELWCGGVSWRSSGEKVSVGKKVAGFDLVSRKHGFEVAAEEHVHEGPEGFGDQASGRLCREASSQGHKLRCWIESVCFKQQNSCCIIRQQHLPL
ncbi:hypothetical protein V5799_015367 [Amblyomma americanum]|uniref:Uncharacterized protein n=1 Tax=Amblyomma americanum TaxID=6943 RepID=A0AAQ4E0D0_AMBAM